MSVNFMIDWSSALIESRFGILVSPFEGASWSGSEWVEEGVYLHIGWYVNSDLICY